MAPAAIRPTLQSALMRQLTNNSSRKKGWLQQGFTLVELMVVIVIVGILSAIALPQFLSQTKKAAATEGVQQASAIAKQAATYYLEQGTIGTVAENCSPYAGTITATGRNFTYKCSGTDAAFVVTGTGSDSNANTKGVTVTATADLTTGTFSKPTVTGI